MGKKGGGSAPEPPDPFETAKAQAQANRKAAIASAELGMINQNTPYGSLEYSQRGTSPAGTPQYSVTQTLAPAQQQLLDLSNRAATTYGQTANTQLDALSQRLSQPLNFEGLGTAPTINEGTRQQAADALYQRINPQLERERAAMETRLANQGIGYGTESWQAAMDDYSRRVNDARLAVDAQAGNEMARQFALEGSARDRAINEATMLRTQPLNELAAMMSGSQVRGPQFVGTPQANVAPADIQGAIYGNYNAEMNAYNQQQQAAAQNRQGLYGLLGTGAQAAAYLAPAMGWSDRRLKTDIRRIGMWRGVGLYLYRYVWGGPLRVGVMADEVPWAAVPIGGYLAVDYAAI